MFTVRGIKIYTKYLRILRYVNWWIFLDSIIKISPRKLAIKKHLVKIYTQIQDRTFRVEKHSKKKSRKRNKTQRK